MGRTVGIDLGTTNSAVAFVQQDRVETILNTEGSKITPSVVMFGENEIIVGELAKRQAVTRQGQVIRSAKRLIGQRYSEARTMLDKLPFPVAEGEGDRADIVLGDGRRIPPEIVSAQVLIKMRDTAEDFLGEIIDGVVITVPAHFNDAQRTATKRAAELADLNVLRIINEPTAAALAYGFAHQNKRQTVAVFDFGGGTFDVSILSIDGDIFEVLSTNGDNHLGGDNIDELLIRQFLRMIMATTDVDPSTDPVAMSRIREAAEKAKIELSSLSTTRVSLPFIVSDESGPKHWEADLTRAEFEAWTEPLLQRLFEPCRRALEDSHLTVGQLSEVILVGGSTRIPRVQRMVAEFFGREPNKSVNPDEVVALGAAIQAGVMRGELAELLLLDVTPLSLGIELAGGVFKSLIDRNSSIPCEATRKYTTVVDNQTSVVVHVLQGERAIAAENRSLARFRLIGIPPMPKELPEVEVTFRIDADGILEVSAVELTSGVNAGVQVEGYTDAAYIQGDELKRILEEVQTFKAKDDEFRRTAGRRAQAHRLQARVDALLDAAADRLPIPHLKSIKESMLRHDLALAAGEWNQLDRHEDDLTEYLDKYELEFNLGGKANVDAMGEPTGRGNDGFDLEFVPSTRSRTSMPQIAVPTDAKLGGGAGGGTGSGGEAGGAGGGTVGAGGGGEAGGPGGSAPRDGFSSGQVGSGSPAHGEVPASGRSSGIIGRVSDKPPAAIDEPLLHSDDEAPPPDDDRTKAKPIPRHKRPLIKADASKEFDFGDDTFGSAPPPPPPPPPK